MRPLTEPETKTLFEKLANYTGSSLSQLLLPTGPVPSSTTSAPKSKAGAAAKEDRHVFRVQKDRVYYVRESVSNFAVSVSRDKLLSLGTCIGKFTKTGKFRLHITALDIIAPHARYKVWVKPNGEMPFLYGGHVVKAHVGRWSEDCPEHQGVVVYSMNDTPLVSRPIWIGLRTGQLTLRQGFGVTARSTAEARRLDPTGIVVFRQGDVGEYLREEDTLFAT
jgi:60S ribosome subunit biogenesis protein NIP7